VEHSRSSVWVSEWPLIALVMTESHDAACARNSQLTLVRLLLKSTTDKNITLSMPVPKRRKSTGSALSLRAASTAFWKLLDIDFVFQKSKTILLYGFTPAVIFAGLQMEPRPSFFDLFNIWE